MSKQVTSPALSEHVRLAVERYIKQMDGYAISGLHAIIMDEVEKQLVETVLDHTGYNQSKAAQSLGISRSTLRKKMDLYDLCS